jgi:shikimate kinase
MATVVLLGCSTSGKSSAMRRFAEIYGSETEIFDTDSMVASDSEFNGHLYAMYLKFTKNGDNSAVQLYLELGERHLLKELAKNEKSIVIAAGPNVALREPEWSNFLAKINPICFYFKLTASQLYEGLKLRRNRQKRKGLDMCPGFGCWDASLSTAYNSSTDNWDELSYEVALPLIEEHIAKVEPIYLSACHAESIYDGEAVKNDKTVQEKVSRQIASCLRWVPLNQRRLETVLHS